jgi:uncharacterized phage-associated protein
MASAMEVATYITKMLSVDNLKLQKLLYYSQAVHLVLHDKAPLFPEAIEAWDYGPVVPPVYRAYKQYGIEQIPMPDETVQTSLAEKEMRSVDMVIACYGEMSGAMLINQTHKEAPWKDFYRSGRPSQVIPIEAMYSYFKEDLVFTDDEI